ncbi:CopG family transcriptional regulator [Candidatus Latescibacterota bacterium]
MKKTQVREVRPQYTAAPKSVAGAIDEAEVVADFLPPPELLVLKEETVKVTLNLSRRSVEFFKDQAARQGVAYQHMVRRILDLYEQRYGGGGD